MACCGTLWDGFGQLAFSLLALVYLIAAGLFFWGAEQPATSTASRHPLAGLRHAWADPLLRRLAPAWLARSLALNGIILGTVGLALLAVLGLALLHERADARFID